MADSSKASSCTLPHDKPIVAARKKPVSSIADSSQWSAKNQEIWEKAFSRWSCELNRQDMQHVDRTPTFEALQKFLISSKKIYKDRTIPRLLERLDPLFSSLKSFTSVFDTFAQAHQVLCLLWGGLKLVIDLASRFKDVLLSMVEMLERIETHLPRLEIYIKAFPDSERVENAALELYCEIIGFCVHAITFLRKHPIRNLIRVAWSSFEKVFNGSLVEIQKCKDAIEVEAFAANIEGAVSRHEELKSLLLQQESTPEPQRKLPCHQILFPKNPRFYGRGDTLHELEASILPCKESPKPRSLALVGFGGVGKTQLALEFVWQHANYFQAILWAQADSMSNLQQSFSSFARRLGLIEDLKAFDAVQTVQMVKQWFEENVDIDWLIVFDNVDEGDILKVFWPVASNGSILVTARNGMPSLTPANQTYSLEPFSAEEGSEVMLSFLGKTTQASSDEPNSDAKVALRLSIDLGGLPLAIAQIAGFIVTTQCTLNEFFDMYKEQREVGRKDSSSNQTLDFYYEHTLDSVWNVTFSKLDGQGLFFMEILAFLDPDAIPERLFEAAWTGLNLELVPLFPASKIEYFQMLGRLLTYDLAKRNPSNTTLSVHRLVQAAIRERMTSERRTFAFKSVINLLFHIYPRQQLGMAMEHAWEDCELFLPQVLAAASHYRNDDGIDFESKQLAELLHNVTWFMQEKGMFEQLLPVAETARKIIADSGEGDSLLMGEIYNTLGNVHLEIGNLEECEENFLKVRDIRVKNCPSNDPIIANINNNLSLAETALGKYESAVQLSYKTISIRESLDNGQYATYKKKTLPINYSNLCRILYTMGELEEAAKIGCRAFDLAKDAFGLKSKNTAQAVFNLADVRMKQGHQDALHLHLQALGLRKDVLGSHYQTAGSCYKVACLLHSQGDLAQSIELLYEALQIYEHSYSAQGGEARTMFKLAQVLNQENRTEEANELRLQAETLRNKLGGSAVEPVAHISAYDCLISYIDR